MGVFRCVHIRVRCFTSFRNPHDGSVIPTVKSLTRTSYMSGEQRVLHLFVWSHAIGSQAGIFPEHLRPHVLRAVCSLQVMCYSTRRKRPFTEAEHRCVRIVCTTYISRHTSHDTHLTTHISRHTSHDTYLTTHMSRHACHDMHCRT